MTPNDQPSLGAPPTPPPVESMKVTIQPKKNCKKCHGLGRIGFIEGDENNPLICDCVIKIYKEAQAQMKQRATEAKELQAKLPIAPEGAQPAPVMPAQIVQGEMVPGCTLIEKVEPCANSANDQPKPPDTI